MARRLLLLLAVLVALTVLAGSIVPVSVPPVQPTPTPTPTATAPIPRAPRAAPAGNPDRPDVRASLTALAARPRRITARVGDSVSITVRAQAVDTIALGDLDVEPVEPGLPARFDVLADEAGSYPLVLVDAQRRIGTLVVR